MEVMIAKASGEGLGGKGGFKTWGRRGDALFWVVMTVGPVSLRRRGLL